MIYRTYATKTNTIASGIFSSYNSSQNPVSDIFFGGGIESGLEKRNSISRFLLYFDLSDLQNKLSTKEINSSLVTGYRLKIKNAIPGNKILEPEYEFDILNKSIAASFDLITFPLNKFFDEGRGYDLGKQNYLVKQVGNIATTGYSNWNNSTFDTTWSEPGVFLNPSASTSFNSTQHFSIGNEDLDMDITQIVNDWLSGGSVNYGLGIAYRRDYELLSTDTRYISSFFSSKTNTAYKPHIEVIYNQSFIDDRVNVTNNRNCKLFLYTFSGNTPVNFYSSSTISIKTAGGVDVFTGLTPIQIEKGVYYVNVWMSAATRGQQYKDIWHGVTFNPGYDQQDFVHTFTVQDNFYLNNFPDINNYSISTYGLDNNSILSTSEIIRVYADLRINFSTNHPKENYDLQYRLVMNNQEAVIPWSSLNRANFNKCSQNYLVLDTSWLLHNQTYEIQFRISELGTIRIMPDAIKFKVLRDF